MPTRHARPSAWRSALSHRHRGPIGAPRGRDGGDSAIPTGDAARFDDLLEAYERSEKRVAVLETLQAASSRISRAGSQVDVARALIAEARRMIDCEAAGVHLIESPDRIVQIAHEHSSGALPSESPSESSSEGFVRWVAEHGEPILANDAGADPRRAIAPSAGKTDADGSVLAVPLRHDARTVGVIALSMSTRDGFDADDRLALTILADQAAAAVESARLLERTQDLAGELRRLLDMSADLSASLDSRQVADLIASHMARAMKVDECAISYWDRPGARIESLGYYPPLSIEQIDPYFDMSHFPLTLRVLERQETWLVDTEDAAADPAEVALLRSNGQRTLALLPLVAKGRSIGLVELFSVSAFSWTTELLELARTMANEAAMALENARLYEDARKLADRDPLTGFYNHRFLHERLGEEVVRTHRARRPLSVLMLDLDDFKLVNDTFGHLFGDRVLTWTAELIHSTLRGSDIPARFGGDEFAIILPETDHAEARMAAERILGAFRDHAFVGEQRGPVPIGVSIGVATYPADGRTATDLISAADEALYRVKREGGHDAASERDPVGGAATGTEGRR
jgi:diguanylate cyclase (GGDEF)-like protein